MPLTQALIPRWPRRQLRNDLVELLSERLYTAPQISELLDIRLSAVRAELFVLRVLHVIRRVAVQTEDENGHIYQTSPDPYYWDFYFELTEHGRDHLVMRAPVSGCAGCRIWHEYQRQLDPAARGCP